MAWDWTRQHRFEVASEVTLPLYMWFYDDASHQARVTAFQVRAELDCAPGIPLQKRKVRSYEVSCRVVDSSVRAAALLADEGLLTPILRRVDSLTANAVLQLQVHTDGRLENVSLEGVDTTWRTMNEMKEALRLVYSRALAGFDLTLPASASEVGAQWIEHDNRIAWLPESRGANTTLNLVHEIAQRDDRVTVIRSAGTGLADTGNNRYDLRIEGACVFDRPAGAISSRRWAILGMPTASSEIASGLAGIPISQVGWIRRLYGDDHADVGDSVEVGPPGERPVELLPWVPLSTSP